MDIVTGLCPNGRVKMERLASLIEYGGINPDSLIIHKFKGFDKVEDALMLMRLCRNHLIIMNFVIHLGYIYILI